MARGRMSLPGLPRRINPAPATRVGVLGACGAVLIAVAACGAQAAPSSSPSATQRVGSAGVSLGTPAVRVSATDQLRFSPATVSVRMGQIVAWSNTGTVMHTITFAAQPSLSDPALNPGATWEIRFTATGSYPYSCTIHSGMDGTVVVAP